jgi:hypothetical protein
MEEKLVEKVMHYLLELLIRRWLSDLERGLIADRRSIFLDKTCLCECEISCILLCEREKRVRLRGCL